MKKYIRMAFVAMTVFFAAVSCEKYDDTELRKEINDLKSKVAALEARITECVNALQSMVSVGSIQSCEFDAKTGTAVITLLDGKTLTINMNAKGYSLLSVMEISGEYYWGICEDGQTTQLLIDGKPVPVTVTPALMISETNEWLISADGGKTWVSTGIFNVVPEEDEKVEEEEEPAPVFFQDVKKEGDYLILTLMDGTTIKVNIVGEAQFEAAQAALYFCKEGIEKSVALTEQNLKAYTITEKPEGWKARVDYNEDEDTYTLIITSPSDIKSAAQSGTVKILGVFNGGQNPEIVSVDVAFEEAFHLSLGIGAAVNVTVSENAFEDITGYLLGVVKASDFSTEAIVAWLNTEEGYLSECYTEAKTFSIEELVENYDPTEAYVVYAIEQIPVKQMLAGTATYVTEDLQIVEVGSTKAKAGISNVRYDSAYISLEFNDMSGYFGGYSELAFWESMGRDNVLESLNVGNMQPITTPTYEGYVNLFPDGVEGSHIRPGTDYVVWIMPETKTPGYEYVADDFILYTFTTAPIVEDTSIPAPACEVKDVTYGGFTAAVTPVAGAYKTYAAIRKTSAVPEDVNQLVDELISINNFSSGSEVLTVTANSFSESDEVCVLAVSVTEDGHFGKVYKQIVPLKTLTYSEDMTVTMSHTIHDLGDVTLSFSFTGNPSTITYYCTSANYFSDETLQDMLARGQIGDAVYDYEISKLNSGNSIEISGLTIGVTYTCYAMVKDASGVPSKMVKAEVIPIVVIDYIMENARNYEYGMPQISGTKSGTKYSLSITKPAECAKYWLFIGDFEYLTGNATNPNIADVYGATDKLVTMQLKDVGALELNSDYSVEYSPVRATTRLYMAWLDDQGNYHSIYTFNVYTGK